MPGFAPILPSHGDARLHLPREGLQIGIGRRERGLQKHLGLPPSLCEISGLQPRAAQPMKGRHAPEPVEEEPGCDPGVAYLPEAFDGLIPVVCNPGEGDTEAVLDTRAVNLSREGDAYFSGHIRNIPDTCANPLFLVRIAVPEGAAGLWIATGAERSGGDSGR